MCYFIVGSLAGFAYKHIKNADDYSNITAEPFTQSVDRRPRIIGSINNFHAHNHFTWCRSKFVPEENEIYSHE
jgi:hypothetical protein